MAELPPRQVRGGEVEGQVLALVNRDGKFCALDTVCPHHGGPLDQGVLWRGALECSWHHFRYDPATGANLYPGNVYPSDMPQLQGEVRAARMYPVQVPGEEVLLSVSEETVQRAWPSARADAECAVPRAGNPDD